MHQISLLGSFFRFVSGYMFRDNFETTFKRAKGEINLQFRDYKNMDTLDFSIN